MIGQGRESNGLYLLDSSHQQRSTALTATNTNPFSSTELWHNRLGHPSFSKLQLLKGVVNIDAFNKTTCCDVCHFSKQKRLPFPISTHISSAPFDLIHCDLWGPFATYNDFSRCTWVYLLKLKSDSQFVILNFANMVKTQSNRSIKTIRSDNGTEFYLKDFFHSNCILHQLSCVDTPQQNAIVERKHQHILNVARALKFQSQVPLCFWGDCILTAVHLINRVPSKSLGNKTPYEMLFHSPPSYTYLRCFGCLCFISTSSSHRHKFAPRSKRCVFLGYPYGIKDYKVLDLATNSVYISRDIVFYEYIFPYASTSSPSTSYLTDFVFPHVNSSSSYTSYCPSFTTPAHSFPDSTPIPDSDLVVSQFDSIALEPTPHTSLPDSNSLEPITHASIPNPVHVTNLDLDITPITQPVQPPLRRSTRPHVPPSYLSDYSCKSIVSAKPQFGLPYALCDFLSYSHLGSRFKSFVLAVNATPSEPVSFHQAVQFPV